MMTAHSTQQTTQQTAHYTFDRWHGCYGRGWGGELVKEAFAHPAKVSFTLAQRIYQHALEAEFIERGGTVLDPFGGIGGFAYAALFGGLQWVGVELEEKFVTLGRANIAMWNERYSHRMWTWGRATLLQGDSRKLLEVVGQADLVVSSPPFGDVGTDDKRKFGGLKNPNLRGATSVINKIYGETSGQLGALPPGNLDMVISSPPFLQSTGGTPQPTNGAIDSALIARHSAGQGATARAYGGGLGQLGGMVEGAFDAVVGSPPFEGNPEARDNLKGKAGIVRVNPRRNGEKLYFTNYERQTADNNLGISSGETFWSAAREIVAQCYAALKPGGVAIWVTKRYVKGGKIVEFTDQWVRLCESVGFVMRCHHHAMLVQDSGAQGDLFGGVQVKRKERKSFFRRLAERKGSPAIDWEDVICMVKPA